MKKISVVNCISSPLAKDSLYFLYIDGASQPCFSAVPHFEKMLYDQGQLANVYLDVFSITKDSFYSCVARDILDYLRRDMIGPNGEIFSAEDADSAEFQGAARKKEGAFYVWTSSEVYSLFLRWRLELADLFVCFLFLVYFNVVFKVEDIVGEHASLFKEHYYIKSSGNCDLSSLSDPHNEFKEKNVLIERISVSAMASKFGMPVEKYHEILGLCRQKLLDVRTKRPRPHLDDKVSHLILAHHMLMLKRYFYSLRQTGPL